MPKTILFLASNAINKQHLRVDEEEKKIRAAWRAATNRDDFDLQCRGAVTADDLRSALSELRPSIIHFSGHGTQSGELVLENSSGKPVPVDPTALSELFRVFDGIECVFLNACYSDTQAKAISQHIPHVIGTSDKIGDVAAIRFAEVFYGSACNGHDYEESHNLAAVQLKLENLAVGYPSTIHVLRKTRILSPRPGEVIKPARNLVSGLAGDDFHQNVYLVTGGGLEKRYWPAIDGGVKADASRKWSGTVHVGTNKGEATISLIRVDNAAAEYIEYYRRYSAAIKYPGFTFAATPHTVLDSVTVKINLMPLRDRLVGQYLEYAGGNSPTAKIVKISIWGEWAIKMECSLNGKEEWESHIMMDESNPNVGKGVYRLSDGRTGHHHITYDPVGESIRVDGYAFPDAVGRHWEKTNTLKRI